MIKPAKTTHVEDLSVALDYDYLLENVGSGIAPDNSTLIVGNKPALWFWYDEDTNQIYEVTFDSVLCVAQHSFGGTLFDKYFYHNNELCEFKNSEGTALDWSHLNIKTDKKALLEEIIKGYGQEMERLNDQLNTLPFRIARLHKKIDTLEKLNDGLNG
jgi:hypothetical protein